MKSRCLRISLLLGAVLIAWLIAAPARLAVLPCSAATLLLPGTSAGFWTNSAFVVAKIVAQTHGKQLTPATPGSFYGPVHIHVLAVLVTERMVTADMTLAVYPCAGDQCLQGPISACAAGTFLVYMTFDLRNHQWYLPGDLGVPFMPKGLESVAVTGLSDPLVKKIQARIEKLIVLAHARE